MQTIKARFEASKKEIRTLGVKVRVNIYECCRGCVGNAKLGLPEGDETTPIIWHYGGQGHAIAWEVDGTPIYREDVYRTYGRNRRRSSANYDAANMLFNHSNLTDELKDQVVAIFEKNGIVVDWDKSDSKCIELDFQATYDQDQIVLAALAVNEDVAVMC